MAKNYLAMNHPDEEYVGKAFSVPGSKKSRQGTIKAKNFPTENYPAKNTLIGIYFSLKCSSEKFPIDQSTAGHFTAKTVHPRRFTSGMFRRYKLAFYGELIAVNCFQ
jgi:hypothetical protein